MMARAMAARLIIPPESSAGINSSKPARSTTSSLSRAMMRMVMGSSSVCSRSGSMMFSPTVMELNSAPPWNATPVFFRSSFKSRALNAARSRPKSRTVPDDGRSSAIRWRRSVLLPEPLPPMMTMISPSTTSRLTPLRIWRGP